MIRVAFVTVVPSPYQRDLFAALAVCPEVAARVFYMEKAAPDSPWPERPLAPHEEYLPGFWFPIRSARVHLNWRLPSPDDYDVIVCNTLMSLTGQWLMRAKLRHSRWIFWGEKLGAAAAVMIFFRRRFTVPARSRRSARGRSATTPRAFRRRASSTFPTTANSRHSSPHRAPRANRARSLFFFADR